MGMNLATRRRLLQTSAVGFGHLALSAMLGEEWKGRTLNESTQVGAAAFIGRILGTIGKVSMGLGILLLAGVSLFA